MSKLGLDNKTRPRSRSVGFPVSNVGRESTPPTPLPPSFQEPVSTLAHPLPRPVEHGVLIDFSSPEVLEGRLIDYEGSSSHIWAMDLEFPSRSSISGSPIRPPSRTSSPRLSLSQHSRAPSLIRREYLSMQAPPVGASPLALASFPTLPEPKQSPVRNSTAFLVDFPRQDTPSSGVLVDVSEPVSLPTPPWETIQLVDVSDDVPFPSSRAPEARRGLKASQPAIFQNTGTTHKSMQQTDDLPSSSDFSNGVKVTSTERNLRLDMINYDEGKHVNGNKTDSPPHHVQEDLDVFDVGDDTLVAEEPLTSSAEHKDAEQPMKVIISGPDTTYSPLQHSTNNNDSHDNPHLMNLSPFVSEQPQEREPSRSVLPIDNAVNVQLDSPPSPVSEGLEEDYSLSKLPASDHTPQDKTSPPLSTPDTLAKVIYSSPKLEHEEFPDPELPSLYEPSTVEAVQSLDIALLPSENSHDDSPDEETAINSTSTHYNLTSKVDAKHEATDNISFPSISTDEFPDPELPVWTEDTPILPEHQLDPELAPSSELEVDAEAPNKRPAWSIRASDAPPLGLTASSSSSNVSPSTPIKSVEAPAKEGEIVTPQPSSSRLNIESEEGDIPGSFPTSDSMDSSDQATSSAVQPAKPAASRRGPRSPIDIALAMQLRPGIGLGSDPAWMVRFLMSMFGWFVVTLSGSGNFERYAPTAALTN